MRRFAGRIAAALVLATLASAAAAGSQMFKCVQGGRTVYQQQACAVTSEPEPAASAANVAKARTEPASAAARKIKPPSPPPSSASATLR